MRNSPANVIGVRLFLFSSSFVRPVRISFICMCIVLNLAGAIIAQESAPSRSRVIDDRALDWEAFGPKGAGRVGFTVTDARLGLPLAGVSVALYSNMDSEFTRSDAHGWVVIDHEKFDTGNSLALTKVGYRATSSLGQSGPYSPVEMERSYEYTLRVLNHLGETTPLHPIRYGARNETPRVARSDIDGFVSIFDGPQRIEDLLVESAFVSTEDCPIGVDGIVYVAPPRMAPKRLTWRTEEFVALGGAGLIQAAEVILIGKLQGDTPETIRKTFPLTPEIIGTSCRFRVEVPDGPRFSLLVKFRLLDRYGRGSVVRHIDPDVAGKWEIALPPATRYKFSSEVLEQLSKRNRHFALMDERRWSKEMSARSEPVANLSDGLLALGLSPRWLAVFGPDCLSAITWLKLEPNGSVVDVPYEAIKNENRRSATESFSIERTANLAPGLVTASLGQVPVFSYTESETESIEVVSFDSSFSGRWVTMFKERKQQGNERYPMSFRLNSEKGAAQRVRWPSAKLVLRAELNGGPAVDVTFAVVNGRTYVFSAVDESLTIEGIPNGPHHIVVGSIGFRSHSFDIEIVEGGSLEINCQLLHK